MKSVTVDFIAGDPDLSLWQLVLVEQGPWSVESIADNLRRVQTRLYGCLDAALDGQLATQYPDSVSKPLVIRLDGYDLPDNDVRAFFERFSTGIFEMPCYKQALSSNSFVSAVSFRLNLEQLPHDA